MLHVSSFPASASPKAGAPPMFFCRRRLRQWGLFIAFRLCFAQDWGSACCMSAASQPLLRRRLGHPPCFSVVEDCVSGACSSRFACVSHKTGLVHVAVSSLPAPPMFFSVGRDCVSGPCSSRFSLRFAQDWGSACCMSAASQPLLRRRLGHPCYRLSSVSCSLSPVTCPLFFFVSSRRSAD